MYESKDMENHLKKIKNRISALREEGGINISPAMEKVILCEVEIAYLSGIIEARKEAKSGNSK
jgi:hypothetical protein